jgi:uncharacterized membrane protein YkvA (DUF1232 family)
MTAKKRTAKKAVAKKSVTKKATTKKAPSKKKKAPKKATIKKALTKKKTPKKKAASRKPTSKKSPRKVTAKQVKKSKSYAEAESKAKQYAKDPKKLKKLVEDATEYSKKVPRGPFGESWAYLMAMIRLIKAYYRGTYREIPVASLVSILITIIYVISPIDLIPDFVPFFGYLDDAMVVGIALTQIQADLDAFMEWEVENA